MNLTGSFLRLLPSSYPKKWRLLRATYHLQSYYSPGAEGSSPIKRTYKNNSKSSTSSSDPKFSKPSEIPYQSKVANSVHLVGFISEPVQLQILPDGVYAASVLVQKNTLRPSPNLSIPVIFQGDLAQIAAFHLKEHDLVHIAGQLSGDALPLEGSQKTVEFAQSHIQVLVKSLDFVEKTFHEKECELRYDQDDAPTDCSAESKETPSNLHLWKNLLAFPHDWWDNRSRKSGAPVSAAFKNKKTDQELWINDSTPDWVLSKLDMLSFGPKPASSLDEPEDGAQSSWNDLVKHPHQWWDYREDKIKGLKNSKHPDFKQKITKKAIWLDTAPHWVLTELDGLIFSGGNVNVERQKDVNAAHTRNTEKGNLNEPDDSTQSLWNDLIKNPHQWWDNRGDKKKGLKSSKHPDFKHKNTKDALWLNTAPRWVWTKLDGLVFSDGNNTVKRQKNVNAVRAKNTEKENLWKNLVENPDKWWDNRSDKKSAKYPDFKHKDTGEPLWLGSSAPSWVLQRLPSLATKQYVAKKAAIQKPETLLS